MSGLTAERIKERRLNRMRLGQAVCEYVPLPSDPETKLCIVPLTEAEYLQVLAKVARLTVPDDLAGVSMRDRTQVIEILVRAIREESDLQQHVFESIDEMLETVEVGDVDELFDRYNEMVERSSPALDAIPDEELENVKKALQTMDWKELSGPAWYACKRFLSRILPSPLLDNFAGSLSTNSSITTRE